MSAQVGPGGGEVGPGGGELGPGPVTASPPSIVLTLSLSVPTSAVTDPRATVGPINAGPVGPHGGLVGPGRGFARIALPPSIELRLSLGRPTLIPPPITLRITPPKNDQPPVGAAWSRGPSNPIIAADVGWEGDFVREPCVIQYAGLYRMWYSGGSPEAIGYATCPDDQDATDPANWTKYAGNPIITAAREPNVIRAGAGYRLFYADVATGVLMVTESGDGFSGWSIPTVALALPSGVGEWGSSFVLRNGAQPMFLPDVPRRPEGTASLMQFSIGMARTNDGVLHWVTQGGSHEGASDAVAYYHRSLDNGATWTPPRAITTSSGGRNVGVAGLLASRTDRLIAAVNSQSNSDRFDVLALVMYSDDGGDTWSTPSALPNPIFGTDYIANGLAQLPDGTVAMSLYGTKPGVAAGNFFCSVALSSDDGATFPVQNVSASSTAHKYEEPTIRWVDDRLVALMRSDTTATTWRNESINGIDWSEPTEVVTISGRPDFVQGYPGGPLLMFGREENTHFRPRLAVSWDKGLHWTPPAEVDAGETREQDYAAMCALADGSILVGYSLSNSLTSNQLYLRHYALAPWTMLVSGTKAFGRWGIFTADSIDGQAFTLGLGRAAYGTLPLVADGAASGPFVRYQEGLFHLWFEATAAHGNLPTDIYHSSSANAHLDAWATPTVILARSGTGFEVDQVARPHIIVVESAGLAFLFYDGQDNGAGTGAIGVAVGFAVGGIRIDAGGDFVTASVTLPFDIGAATAEVTLPFDLEAPPVTADITLPFGIDGLAGTEVTLPFDLEGPVTTEITLPFDLLDAPTVDEVQVISPGGVISGGTYTLTFDGQATAPIAAGGNAAAVQAALEALSNVAPGDITVTGGPLTSAALTLTFGGAYAGIDVPQVAVNASGLTGTNPSAIGLTTQNGGQVSVGGQPVRGIPPLWLPLMVFDKAGNYLGSINAFNVTNPPVRYIRSRRVTNEGGMTFNVPRSSPDMDLIADDRLVRLQSPRGEKPWWGTMSSQLSARGIVEVVCKDPWTLFRDGRGIVLKEELSDDTPATAVFAHILELHNDLRARDGEVGWELDASGSRPFRGDIDFDADTLTCLDTAIGRSRTELAWDSRLEGNRLVPILRVRDRFDAGAGADIFDGPDGNVTAGAQVIQDPSPLVFSIRLRGTTTDLAACLPQWAQWALLDITPEVRAEIDSGEHRMREDRTESVDWGLSKAAIAAQCNAILDWLWGLYRSYLRAIHDIEGRPNHQGWAYLGAPDIYEPKSSGKDSMSRRAWRTRLQLVEVRTDEPASAVMISEDHSQINLREWLIVRFNRVTGVQNVTVWAIETAAGLELIKWNLTGSATLYHVSGDRIIGRSTISTTGAFVDPYNTRIYDPVAKRYRELRRIINGPFALAYYIDPADPDNAFVDLGVDAAISTTSGDGSSLIAKMYDFERFAIENWDPRRDGIGARLSRPTVFFGSPTTRPRWHVVSFDVGGGANTQLTHGISAGETDIEVDSIFGFPDPDLEPDAFPFLVAIDDGLDEEQVMVTSMTGTLWHVLRGQNGTTAIIHEAGAPVRRFGADAWPGFPFPYTWPEGQQWAEAELAELSKPRIDLGIHVAHFRDDQLSIDYGSSHAVDVATEGAPDRWAGTGRVIGWSTDPGHNPSADDPTPAGGETEVVLEWTE